MKLFYSMLLIGLTQITFAHAGGDGEQACGRSDRSLPNCICLNSNSDIVSSEGQRYKCTLSPSNPSYDAFVDARTVNTYTSGCNFPFQRKIGSNVCYYYELIPVE